MLYLKGDHVKKECITDCIPDAPREYLNYVPLLKLSPKGVWGEPSLATKEKGEAVCRILVSEGIRYIENTFKRLEDIK
jgi:creatinine amidohydrolase